MPIKSIFNETPFSLLDDKTPSAWPQNTNKEQQIRQQIYFMIVYHYLKINLTSITEVYGNININAPIGTNEYCLCYNIERLT